MKEFLKGNYKLDRVIEEPEDAENAVATNSCTAAMHLALLANGIGSGEEVIVPSMTFSATANVVEHVGARPVFADSAADGFHIDPSEIQNRITPRTRAVIPVHFAGLPCAMDEINAIAREQGLLVIEDAAHAAGAEYYGERIGLQRPDRTQQGLGVGVRQRPSAWILVRFGRKQARDHSLIRSCFDCLGETRHDSGLSALLRQGRIGGYSASVRIELAGTRETGRRV